MLSLLLLLCHASCFHCCWDFFSVLVCKVAYDQYYHVLVCSLVHYNVLYELIYGRMFMDETNHSRVEFSFAPLPKTSQDGNVLVNPYPSKVMGLTSFRPDMFIFHLTKFDTDI